MPDQTIENDVNQISAEGVVIPAAPEATPPTEPLPGQPEPGDSPDPQADANKLDEKTVPLAALHEERGKRQELQAELEALRQVAGDNVLFDMNGRPVAAPQQQQQQGPTVPRTDTAGEDMEKLWEDNPRRAVQMEIMAANQWRDQQEAQMDQQLLTAKGKYDDFGRHESTVRQYIRTLPVTHRGKPGVVDLAYYVVKGQNSGMAIEQAKAEILRKIQAGENVQGLPTGTQAAPPVKKGIVLNAEQLRVADAMGLTPEQYTSEIKKVK